MSQGGFHPSPCKNRVEVNKSQSRCFVTRMSSVNTQLFCCSICDFRIPYDTKGRGSKYLSKEIQILEDAYIMRDPFADNNLGGIILGADCCLCKRMVCVSQALSASAGINLAHSFIGASPIRHRKERKNQARV
ncbi:hypothetical protein FGIG_06540 [Fasciola gigantica]|uniref:Cysteine-rich DPF motif domain-containing protein 1 n=1 Tax=Fasciola gigantica TaxID=46835 RepID=A0A504YHZ2_FASGI|nr:hypothetical protein FGIG_06540 [Fasciola gigantica]